MENSNEIEQILLDAYNKIGIINRALFSDKGGESYNERCYNHDIGRVIFKLTNKFKNENNDFKSIFNIDTITDTKI